MNISDEEKIKLMLESIMTNVELIERNTRGLDAEVLTKELHELSQRIGTRTKSSIELEGLEQKIANLENSLRAAGEQSLTNKINSHHSLWFFPDLKKWLRTFRRGRFVLLLASISLVLLIFTFLKHSEYKKYQVGYYKYQYLLIASDDNKSLKKYEEEWGLDSVRGIRVKWVKRTGEANN